MKRESWNSTFGFTMAAVGSAVGLANIWRFPYILGTNGGGAFLFLYLIFLILIGLPVFVTEVFMGSHAKKGPQGTFYLFGKTKLWKFTGQGVIWTGFMISSFYSVVAGWLLSYAFDSITGSFSFPLISTTVSLHFDKMLASPWRLIFFHMSFLLLSGLVLIGGVQKGIERSCQWMMPLLLLLLLALAIHGLSLDGASRALDFLFTPDWSKVTGHTLLLALGQAFFTLSLGQGTMITYGSYIKHKSSVLPMVLPVLGVDTLVSLLSGVAVFTMVFSAGIESSASGPGLIFKTLPLAFSAMPGGHLLMMVFFLLVIIAALSSEISALEPMICYLKDEKGYSRKKAVLIACSGAFILGVPCALSFNIFKNWKIFSMNLLDFVSFITTSILVPLGALAAVILIARWWPKDQAVSSWLTPGRQLNVIIEKYFYFSIKFLAPIAIIIIFIYSLIY